MKVFIEKLKTTLLSITHFIHTYGFKNSGDEFIHNIVSKNYYPIWVNDWGKQVDYNLFPDTSSLNKARKNGTDMHSLAGPPRFKNHSLGDYTVIEGSPALQIGFKNFEMNDFGVTSSNLRNLAEKIQLPEFTEPTEQPKVPEETTNKWLGIIVKNLTTLGERSATGMSSETGVLVLEVPSASTLSKDLKPGDVILSVNKKKISTTNDLEGALADEQKAKKFPVIIYRNQKEQLLNINLK